VEALVAEEMGDNPLANRRRGMKGIWESVERDHQRQQDLHSTNDEIAQCIEVKPKE
jgi:hypothetical protein